MDRVLRLPRSLASSAVIVAAAALAGLFVIALLLQPPAAESSSSLERLLGWARAGMLTAGAIALLAALGAGLRGDRAAMPAQPASLVRSTARGAFTLIALGRTPDDTRAIADAEDAPSAVALLWRWSDEHPDEQVVVFAPDGEPVAFRRSAINHEPLAISH
jgi:hypothetical protein